MKGIEPPKQMAAEQAATPLTRNLCGYGKKQLRVPNLQSLEEHVSKNN